jgi:hypothetical protein
MATDTTAFQHLWVLLEGHRPIAVHSHLIRIAGSAKTAVLLSQLVYWTRRCAAVPSAPGWIHKTGDQWFRELGLSRREQESARKALRTLNVLEEALRGQPALRYYRLRLPQLGQLLTARFGLVQAMADPAGLWADEALVRELLGRALPYHRVLAYLTGSVNAALLLTWVIFQHLRHLLSQGWFRFSRREMESDLGLTHWELDTARKCLRGKRLVEERLAHLPTRLYARAVPPVISGALRRLGAEQTAGTDQEPRMRRSARPIVGFSADRAAAMRQADSRNSRQSACPKADPQFGGMPSPSLAENLPSISGVITAVDLTTTTADRPPAAPLTRTVEVVVVQENDRIIAGDRLDNGRRLTVRRAEARSLPHPVASPESETDGARTLIFPADFLPEERDSAAAELAALPAERAQLVLDEVAGRSRKQRAVHTRVGLVRSLARAEREGRFCPAYAWEIRDARRRARAREVERQAWESRVRTTVSGAGEHRGAGAGYAAFKAFAARWPRSMARRIPDHDEREDIE